MMPSKIFLCLAAFSACLLTGIVCGQIDDGSYLSRPNIDLGSLDDSWDSGVTSKIPIVSELIRCADCPPRCSECPFSPYYAIWSLNKYGSQHWNLNTAEQVLKQNGFTILDPAANQNVHVMGRRNNPEVIVAVVCTWIGQLQTAVVIFGTSPDENAVQTTSAQVRDQIERAQSLEGDVVQNPVQA